ncbi:MAG: Hsp70 family protein, partial [Caldilineaceae bacterium]|nr:Hsp70 family protein [Caldilineaceae bacterium]
MSEIIGIDLGTTNSGVAVWRDGKPQMIADADGYHLTPSVVALDPDNGQWMVGRQALRLQEHNPRAAIYSIKRLIGRRHEELDVASLHVHILYEIERARGQRGVAVRVGDKALTPQQVSALILRKLKADAEAYLGHPVSQAVITVPAYFHESQRQATRDAGRIAGLEVKRVLNEPTAACLAFAYERLHQERHNVAVFDLGGGTFDVSLLETQEGRLRVIDHDGDNFLGGRDMDRAVLDYVCQWLA